ncbi:hypothetical protein [Streptomyces echinatus]|uniref:Peptidase M10 metallopeptidase domain-containing protein n=1 Tax=Streptomyces echinatus TaxID=67293 RepID=A0A7W9Q285_9ACTN|nr:hypothetical protein [Streptomyces echinatus]MBB5932288.1 hypothetical protein [Streptomyces echinatus]
MRAARLTLPAILAALLLAVAPGQASAATPVYSGTGWRAWTANGIYSLAPDGYTIVFADDTARTKLAPYFKTPANQVTTSVGVPITVTTALDDTPISSCPSRHAIVVHYLYRPTGKAGVSKALACHDTADDSAWGGHLLIDSEYWTSSNWFSTNATLNDIYRKNVVSHELGHIFGLDHPNYDRDKDGTVEDFECVVSDAGWLPVECAPNGGYRTSTGAGKFLTAYDLAGLKQLAANYWLR